MDNKEKKEYGGCLGILLPLWMIGQILTIIYSLAFVGFYKDFPLIPIILIGTNIIALVGIILLFQYNKIGFYIFILSFVISFFVGLYFPDYVEDKIIFRSIFGLGMFLLLMSFKNKETKLNGYQTLGIFSKINENGDVEVPTECDNALKEIDNNAGEIPLTIEEEIPLTIEEEIPSTIEKDLSSKINLANNIEKEVNVKEFNISRGQSKNLLKDTNFCEEQSFSHKNNSNRVKRQNKTIIILVITIIFLIVGAVIILIHDWRSDEEIFQDGKKNIEEQKYEMGIEDLEKIQDNYIPAKAYLGKLLTLNDSVKRDTKRGEELLWEAFEANDTNACMTLSDIYLERGDWMKLKQIYEKSIEIGLWKGYRGLTRIYFLEEIGGNYNIHKDYKKAEYYALKVANKDSWSCALLGFIYATGGNEIEQDYNKAFYWWNKGAELGGEKCEICYYNLGLLYQFGNGVKQNFKKAYESFKKSVHINEKYYPSYYNLSYMFRLGQYVNFNSDSVYYYLKKAAKYGCVEASVELENDF